MAWENVSDASLLTILAKATAARAERKGEPLLIAAGAVLSVARKEFAVPGARLPNGDDLVLMASALAQP